jgi:hypothetical protein
MSLVPSLLEGTLSAKAFDNTIAGTRSGSIESCKSGMLRGLAGGGSIGSPAQDSAESPEGTAAADVGNLISSLGSLSAQAQSLPLSPPTLPGLPQGQGYHPSATDYMQFADESN